MSTDITEKLKTVFIDALSLTSEVEVEKLEYNSIRNWDSVAHMTLVAAIEDSFDIMLETDDVIDMSSFAKAVEIVAKNV
jgi:acyl carrier protein